MSQFHFLRPEWFAALLPVALVLVIAWRSAGTATARDWAGSVDAHLLRHLTVSGAAARPSRGLLMALAAGMVAAVLAMTGPTWEKLPTPTITGGEPAVVVLSLAQSMNGTDLVPSRLSRAGHKLRDILARENGEDVGLVIYADRPFVAAPLTPDAAVIREMLPELSTSLMPVLGNRLNLAIDSAHKLLTSAGAARGRILVMADDPGIDPDASRAAAAAARADGYTVSVLGVGTEAGAQLQTADGRAIRAAGQDQTVARLDPAAMQSLARAGGGSYAEVTATSADIDTLLPTTTTSAGPGRASALKADRWLDRGYLLLLLPVLLMPLAFRRGVLFALALGLTGLIGGMAPTSASAASWASLWSTPDQQAARDFAAGDYADAATTFTSPDWRAGALYRAGDYAQAAAIYGEAGYNAGNALARAGKFKDALAAYDARLAAAPDDADAKFNRDLVAELLKQQQEKEKEKEKQQDQQQTGQQDQDQQQAGQQAQDQQQAGQQDQDQQQASQQGQDQQQTGQQGQDQKQAGQQGQDQQQAGQQAQDQQQAGQQDQDKQQANQQAQDQQQASQQAQGAPAGQSAPQDDGVLSELIDKLLQGNGTPADEPAKDQPQVATTGAEPLSQAAEQQLRAVPDDPSGLLRARIRMHYAQLRANGQ